MVERIRGGMNPTFRAGNTFIKHVAKGGSPHAEVAASQAMGILGVKNNPVRLRTLKRQVEISEPRGVWHNLVGHVLTSPFLPMTAIHNLGQGGDQSHVEPLSNYKQHYDTLLGEWINAISDRHAGNYALTPQHGIISIDHGMAFHPGTNAWGKVVEGNPMEGYNKLEGEPRNWSENPDSSSLMDRVYNQYDERTHGLGTDHRVAQAALANQEKLENLAYEGSKDLPESERTLARMAMRVRLNVLEHFLKKHPTSKIGRDELQHLHQSAIALAQKTFGGRRGFP